MDGLNYNLVLPWFRYLLGHFAKSQKDSGPVYAPLTTLKSQMFGRSGDKDLVLATNSLQVAFRATVLSDRKATVESYDLILK